MIFLTFLKFLGMFLSKILTQFFIAISFYCEHISLSVISIVNMYAGMRFHDVTE